MNIIVHFSCRRLPVIDMSPKKHSKMLEIEGISNSLNQHYEDMVRPYIDLVDSLRSLGIEKDLNLPAIAVIGDQSSGKSSVLEALSGVALPRGTGETNKHTHTKHTDSLLCDIVRTNVLDLQDHGEIHTH